MYSIIVDFHWQDKGELIFAGDCILFSTAEVYRVCSRLTLVRLLSLGTCQLDIASFNGKLKQLGWKLGCATRGMPLLIAFAFRSSSCQVRMIFEKRGISNYHHTYTYVHTFARTRVSKAPSSTQFS